MKIWSNNITTKQANHKPLLPPLTRHLMSETAAHHTHCLPPDALVQTHTGNHSIEQCRQLGTKTAGGGTVLSHCVYWHMNILFEGTPIFGLITCGCMHKGMCMCMCVCACVVCVCVCVCVCVFVCVWYNDYITCVIT